MKHSPETRSINRTETRTPKSPQLQAALNALVKGDELVVTALSRLGRDQRSVSNRLHDPQDKGLHVRTLVERELKRERTLESVQHRRETGGSVGERPETNKVKKVLCFASVRRVVLIDPSGNNQVWPSQRSAGLFVMRR